MPALGAISVMSIPAVDFRGAKLTIDQAAVAAKAKDTLEHGRVFAADAGARASVAVGLEAFPFTEGSADALEIGVKLHLRMTVRPAGAAPSRFADDVAAVGRAPLATHDLDAARAAFQRLAERTVADLLQSYVDRQALWASDGNGVARALASPDADTRSEALRIVATRRLRQLAPAVVRLLTDDEEGVRDAALGAVIAIGDRSAVKVLASSRQMRDAREMRKVIDAIAVLGGREAREYLGFVAETHDDEEIRSLAKAALKRMDAAESSRPTK